MKEPEMQAIAEEIKRELLHRLGDEVELIFHYGSTVKGSAHRWSDLDFSYVPGHPSTWECITVMVDDILFDLYPLHWSKLERMAEWDDWSSTILGHLQVTYSKNEKVDSRLKNLCARHRFLQEPDARRTMTEKALNRFQTIGYEYYQLQRQARRGGQEASRHHANRILQTVLHCLVILNQSLSDTRKLDQMMLLESKPAGFKKLIEQVVSAQSIDDLIHAIDQLVEATHALLLDKQRSLLTVKANYPERLCSAYPELKADLQRVIIACEKQDAWGAESKLLSFLHELHIHIAQAEDGVDYTMFNSPAEYDRQLTQKGFPALLPLLTAGRFDELAEACWKFDEKLRQYLVDRGVSLNCFDSIDELKTWMASRRES